jgi:hypothetical protein
MLGAESWSSELSPEVRSSFICADVQPFHCQVLVAFSPPSIPVTAPESDLVALSNSNNSREVTLMTIHEMPHPYARFTGWCGPAAVHILTGCGYQEACRLVQEMQRDAVFDPQARTSQVRFETALAALDRLGYVAAPLDVVLETDYSILTGRMGSTVYRWVRGNVVLTQKHPVLLQVGYHNKTSSGHGVVAYRGQLIDNWSAILLSIERHRFRRMLVARAWAVTPKLH